VGRISRKCLRFAREHDLPIFIVAQLNREKPDDPLDIIDKVGESSGISRDTTYGLALVKKGEYRNLYRTKARHGDRMQLDNVSFNTLTGRYNTDY
jgi:hypothetical protein